jgi:flagellar biosynthesis protein FlhF
VDGGQLDLFLEGFERAVAPFLAPDDSVREAVSDYIVARLPTVRDHRRSDAPRTIAFVGQSGVGKSSAAAGLAARYRAAGITVALIAAGGEPADILQTGARRHDVQLFHAPDGPALRTLLGTLADRDLIIIDTDGRSHAQTAEMVALGVMLGGVPLDEVHLVAAAATPLADLADVHERFAPVGVNRITMTKIDETRFPGNLVNAPLCVGIPLGYLSSGTVVPDALAPADGRRVAELLLP